jgi:hypothetical protein
MSKQKIKIIIIAILSACLAACIGIFMIFKVINFYAGKIMTNTLSKTRATLYGDVPKNKRKLVGFGERIAQEIDYGSKEGDTTVQDYLDAGCDPNYCLMLLESLDCRNPLMLFNVAAMYSTFFSENPTYPDVLVFNELIKAGADINKYPYVWAAVFCHGNGLIRKSKRQFENGSVTEEEMNAEIQSDIADSNRVLKLFLDAGADVNRKGSPIPFEFEKSEKITEEEIQACFNSPEATTPIYEAIKKGTVWESQVDLLLQYGAKLDGTCIEAAKLSGDEGMIKKVEGLLKKENR